MANQKISELPAATSLTGDELIPVVQGGVNKTATPDDIVALAPVSSGTLGAVQLSDGAGGFSSDAGLSYDSGVLTVSSVAGIAGSPLSLSSPDASTTVTLSDGGTFDITGVSGVTFAALQFNSSVITINSNGVSLILDQPGNTFGFPVITVSVAPLVPGVGNEQDLGFFDDLLGVDLRWRTGYFGTSVVTPDVVMSSGAASVIILPTADPLVTGALWNNLGTITISAGP